MRKLGRGSNTHAPGAHGAGTAPARDPAPEPQSRGGPRGATGCTQTSWDRGSLPWVFLVGLKPNGNGRRGPAGRDPSPGEGVGRVRAGCMSRARGQGVRAGCVGREHKQGVWAGNAGRACRQAAWAGNTRSACRQCIKAGNAGRACGQGGQAGQRAGRCSFSTCAGRGEKGQERG